MNIGILGGTFDPIHNGHLHLARRAAELFFLEQVHFVPAQIPPHKRGERISSAYHRFAMLALALSQEPRFLVSTLELEPGSSPYTVDTLGEFRRRLNLAPHQLFFIAGGDSFQCIPTWKNYEELLTNYNMLFIERPDSRIDPEILELPEKLRSRILDLRHWGPNPAMTTLPPDGRQDLSRIYLLQLDAPDISSTCIRIRSRQEKECRDLVPEIVADYINKHHLYIK